MGTLFYGNSDFELSLQDKSVPTKLKRVVSELALPLTTILSKEDTLLCDITISRNE